MARLDELLELLSTKKTGKGRGTKISMSRGPGSQIWGSRCSPPRPMEKGVCVGGVAGALLCLRKELGPCSF